MEESLNDLLLQRARLDIELRKRLKHIKNRYFTYVLLLQNNNIYVGSTNNLFLRLLEHLHETELSSHWVRLHGPVIRVLEVSTQAQVEDECYKTLEYMHMFGWESVRGGSWCKVDLRGPPAALHTFKRDRGDFQYLSREEIDKAVSISRQLAEDLYASSSSIVPSS